MYEASKSRKIQIMEVLQYLKNGKYLKMLKTRVVILETQMMHKSVDEKVSLLVRNVSEIRKGAKHLNVARGPVRWPGRQRCLPSSLCGIPGSTQQERNDSSKMSSDCTHRLWHTRPHTHTTQLKVEKTIYLL